MKKKSILIVCLALIGTNALTAQCNNDTGNPLDDDATTYCGGKIPMGAAIYSDFTMLTQNGFVGTYVKVAKMVNGRNYNIASSVATDYLTIRQGATVIVHGTGSVNFTAPNANDIAIHINDNAACGVTSFALRRISMNYPSGAAAPTTAPANNNCSAAVAVPDANIYASGAIPTAPSFTANTAVATNANALICGGGGGGDDDVWFSFKAPSTSVRLRHDNLIQAGGTIFASPVQFMGVGVFATCSSNTVTGTYAVGAGGATTNCVITNLTSNEVNITGLTKDVTYYIRIYGNSPTTYAQADFYLSNAIAIPVELVDFKAKYTLNANQLTWTTATERNVERFDIQRSNDGATNWQSIGSMKAKGNSNALSSYQFADETPLRTSYYRLNTIDADGKTDVSKIVSVNRQNNGKLTLTKAVLSVYTEGSLLEVNINTERSSTVTAILTDALGRVVLTKSYATDGGDSQIQIPTIGLAKGVYILNLTDGDSRISTKIVKQ